MNDSMAGTGHGEPRQASHHGQQQRRHHVGSQARNHHKRGRHGQRHERPDHFIGIRIRAPTAEIRAKIRSACPGIVSYMEEPEKQHVTLGVLCLDTEDKVARCKAHFENAAKNLRERGLFPAATGFDVSFDRFDMFGDRVLFLKPTEASIAQFREVRACLFDEHVSVFDSERRREYNPHMTLAKRTGWVSKSRQVGSAGSGQQQQHVPEMPKDVGVLDGIAVDVRAVAMTVELVRMRGEKEKDGYYKVLASESLCGGK